MIVLTPLLADTLAAIIAHQPASLDALSATLGKSRNTIRSRCYELYRRGMTVPYRASGQPESVWHPAIPMPPHRCMTPAELREMQRRHALHAGIASSQKALLRRALNDEPLEYDDKPDPLLTVKHSHREVGQWTLDHAVAITSVWSLVSSSPVDAPAHAPLGAGSARRDFRPPAR